MGDEYNPNPQGEETREDAGAERDASGIGITVTIRNRETGKTVTAAGKIRRMNQSRKSAGSIRRGRLSQYVRWQSSLSAAVSASVFWR